MADAPEQASKPESKAGFLHRHATFLWVAYWVVLTGLLHSPKLPAPPRSIPRPDIAAHFTTFALLTALCVFALRVRGRFTRWHLIIWTLVLVAYGGISELLQPLSNRHCDLMDFVANSTGVAVIMLIVVTKRLFTPKPTE